MKEINKVVDKNKKLIYLILLIITDHK